MAQNFTPGTPATASVPQSVTMRDNFEALLTNHAGNPVPAYAVEGMVWYDSATKRLKKIAPYGSKAYVNFMMGATINLAVAIKGAGQDGSTYLADCRLQDSTFLPGDDHDWTLAALNLSLFFRNDKLPSYFAATKWDDAVIDEPLLWTADGILIGKTWEVIPSGHENLYGTSPLSNIAPFAANTLRAVGIEYADQVIKIPFTTAGVEDHVFLASSMEWWEWQDGIEIELWDNGYKRHPSTYKARPIYNGTTIGFIVYNIEPGTTNLQPFSTNPLELIVRKMV